MALRHARVAAVRARDLPDERETEAGTDLCWLGREVGLEHALAELRRDSRSGVLDPEDHVLALGACRDHDLAAAVAERLRRIDDQIRHELPEACLRAADQWQLAKLEHDRRRVLVRRPSE